MLEYSKTDLHTTDIFLAFTKLNNAKCVSVEPALTIGGEPEYARKLLEEIVKKDGVSENVKGSNSE